MKLKKSDKIALAIIGLIVIIMIAMYFTFYYYHTCEDMSCYVAHQKECSRTRFVNDAENTVWEYLIKGTTNGKCEINVKVLRVKTGDVSQKKLEGKEMTCYIPKGSKSLPEADIAMCNGKLKEQLQNMIIQKLHTYILENLGEIGQELQTAF
ncbi:hypothetical protein GF378_02890 [Candidatus Pacearchaeota archaeon]|nr:hypothetical protein [Candidatus Pacearchaeota archaeon]